MLPSTLKDIFFAIIERNSERVMMDRRTGVWVPISAKELYRNVMGVLCGLAECGIAPGDRVAILSENRPEWTIADFACLLRGAVVVPLYTTLTADQTAHILNDSGARAIFVSDEKHLQKVLSIQSQTPVEMVFVMDPVETAHAKHMYRLMQNGPRQRDPDLERTVQDLRPDDIATIIYTSGTTGVPKGVVLSHGNMASNLACSMHGFVFSEREVSVSFLPLSHVTARHVDFVLLHHGVTLAYAPSVQLLPQALLEVQPTMIVGVPRVYEKVHTQVVVKASGFPKRWIYEWAMWIGRAHRAEVLAGKVPQSMAWKLAHRLVFAKVHAGMGGRAHTYISGGAPLGRRLAEWYADIGIRIHEGYGLTETSPVIAVNMPGAHKLGTVGKPLTNIEVRIADDGEVLVRGPSVFKSYWNKPQETQAAFIDEWFKTGDVGHLDEDGFLSITDRKKDLIKTSGGKFIAPQPIENALKHNPLVAEAVVLGDKRKFPAVLIVPYFPLLEDWARTNQIVFSTREDLVAEARVRSLYDGIVEEQNKDLARFEKLKRVMLVPDEFSAENGTLTASMKLRRRTVEERYRVEIEQMYAEAELVAVDRAE